MIEIDPRITALVGMTGSGKTSFLTMLTGLDPAKVFPETELPNGSEIKQKFSNGELRASDILQLTGVFTVEGSDQELLPDEFIGVTEIQIDRYFDGHFEIGTSKGSRKQGQVDLEAIITNIKAILENMKNNFTNAQARIAIQQHLDSLLKAINSFLQTNFGNLKELDLSLQSLTNTINGLPRDAQLQNEFNQRIAELSAERKNIATALENDPVKKLIAIIPKPLYKSEAVELEDKIGVDDFINKPERSKTFHNLAVISGLKPSGVQKVRNATTAERNSYFDVISRNLSEQLNKFWRQEKYDFKIGIDAYQLTFTVADRTTNKVTSVLEGSDGFRWWTSFFLEMSADLAERSGLSIVLLDNPATSLHDEGKADVLRFLTSMIESGKLQIVYTSHERALIDPWRVDRIRIVEKRPDGTKIEKLRSDPRSDFFEKIRRNIGSPAKYSLFGAPRTVAFEGISDMNIISAFNEYLEQQGLDHLNKDSYSINAFNGINNAPEFCKLFKNLGIDFVLVVDSGSDIVDMKKKMDKSDYAKYFIEIKDVINEEGDIEDLIEPRLYHLAFERAYKNILDDIPTLEAIEKRGKNKKTVKKYSEWFVYNGTEFNKTIVAQQMFNLLMHDTDADHIGKDIIERSTANFIKLFNLIQKKFSENS